MKEFNLESITINISGFKPLGKFLFSFDRVRKNTKWKIWVGDCTFTHLPFIIGKGEQNKFQKELERVGTDVVMYDGGIETKFYTFTSNTLAEVSHPYLTKYLECVEKGIKY